MQQLLALGVVEASIALMGVTLGLAGRRRERRAFRAKFAPYTHHED